MTRAKTLIDLSPGDRILISRSDRLGDLVLALPFVETMKLRYPDCKIDVLASLYASPILENNKRIDGIVRVQNDQLVTNKLYKKDLLAKIRRSKYKAVVALFPERHICHLFYKAGIPIRIGTAGRFHSFLFNYRLRHSRKAMRKHEAEYNHDFLSYFVDGDKVDRPHVYPREKEINNATRLLKDAGVSDPFVVLHPGSGGSAERWPFTRFIELYRRLTAAGVDAVISGSESEGESIAQLAAKQNVKIRKVTGETDLRALAAVLSKAEVVVANSTGPLHLAVAVGTKVVGLYPSKNVMSPKRWGPLGDSDRVIVPQTGDCSCPPKACTCMESITVDQVASEVLALLGRRMAAVRHV